MPDTPPDGNVGDRAGDRVAGTQEIPAGTADRNVHGRLALVPCDAVALGGTPPGIDQDWRKPARSLLAL